VAVRHPSARCAEAAQAAAHLIELTFGRNMARQQSSVSCRAAYTPRAATVHATTIVCLPGEVSAVLRMFADIRGAA
jgi:hypothetical protein